MGGEAARELAAQPPAHRVRAAAGHGPTPREDARGLPELRTWAAAARAGVRWRWAVLGPAEQTPLSNHRATARCLAWPRGCAPSGRVAGWSAAGASDERPSNKTLKLAREVEGALVLLRGGSLPSCHGQAAELRSASVQQVASRMTAVGNIRAIEPPSSAPDVPTAEVIFQFNSTKGDIDLEKFREAIRSHIQAAPAAPGAPSSHFLRGPMYSVRLMPQSAQALMFGVTFSDTNGSPGRHVRHLAMETAEGIPGLLKRYPGFWKRRRIKWKAEVVHEDNFTGIVNQAPRSWRSRLKSSFLAPQAVSALASTITVSVGVVLYKATGDGLVAKLQNGWEYFLVVPSTWLVISVVLSITEGRTRSWKLKDWTE